MLYGSWLHLGDDNHGRGCLALWLMPLGNGNLVRLDTAILQIMGEDNISIGLTGDVMIGRSVDTVITKEGYAYPWGNVLPLLKGTDMNIINLETTLTASNEMAIKQFNFKATTDKIATLELAGISVANLANNHILDFSGEGMHETIQTLRSAGIEYVGAGSNDREAARPVSLVRDGIVVGVLGFTDNEPGWKAGPSTCGTNYINLSSKEDCRRLLFCIARLRRESDIVVVSMHWGPNMKAFPDDRFKFLAHEMIDSGADIIHGHSAHNFQGIEVYRRKLILYDAGDFVDDYAVDAIFRNDHSFFFRVEASKKELIKLEIIPVIIANCQVNLATGEDKQWCMRRMKDLSKQFGTMLNETGEILF